MDLKKENIRVSDGLEGEVEILPENTVSRIDGNKNVACFYIIRDGIKTTHFVPADNWQSKDEILKIIIPEDSTFISGTYGNPRPRDCNSFYWTFAGNKYSADGVAQFQFGKQ